MAKYHQITQIDMNMAHALNEAGLTKSKIADIMKRSYNCVTDMLACKTLAEYKQFIHERNMKRKTKETPVQVADVSLEPDDYSAEQWRKTIVSQLNSMIAILKAIEYKLE